MTAVEKLGASLDYFTNPFLLVGEGKFSWRQSNVGLARLNAFERVARALDRGQPEACPSGREASTEPAADAQAHAQKHVRGRHGGGRAVCRMISSLDRFRPSASPRSWSAGSASSS